jgi:hypothetical protein
MPQHYRTPVEQIESLCQDLIAHYGDGEDRELRIAAKMLLVTLDQFRQHGGHRWPGLVREYLSIAEHDPEKFESILRANRSEKSENTMLF